MVGLLEDSGSYRYPQPVKKTGLAPSFWTQIGDATNATLSYYYLKEDSVTTTASPALFVNQGKGTFLGFSKVSPSQRITALPTTTSRITRRAIATFKVRSCIQRTR